MKVREILVNAWKNGAVNSSAAEEIQNQILNSAGVPMRLVEEAIRRVEQEVRQTCDLPTDVDLLRGFQSNVPLQLYVYNDFFLPGQRVEIRFKLVNQGVKAWKSVVFQVKPDEGCGVFNRASRATQMGPGQESEIIAYMKLPDDSSGGSFPGVVRIQIEDSFGNWSVYDCDQFSCVTVKEADAQNLSIQINKTQNAGQGGVVYNPEEHKEGLLQDMQPLLDHLQNRYRLPVGFKYRFFTSLPLMFNQAETETLRKEKSGAAAGPMLVQTTPKEDTNRARVIQPPLMLLFPDPAARRKVFVFGQGALGVGKAEGMFLREQPNEYLRARLQPGQMLSSNIEQTHPPFPGMGGGAIRPGQPADPFLRNDIVVQFVSGENGTPVPENQLENNKISRIHMALECGRTATLAWDVGAKNRVFVGSNVVEEGKSLRLQDNAAISLGRKLRFLYREYRQGEAVRSGHGRGSTSGDFDRLRNAQFAEEDARPLNAIRLIRLDSMRSYMEYVNILQEATIGSSEDCVIPIPHPSVSELHAKLILENNLIYVVDRNVTSRTQIETNGKIETISNSVARALHLGDRLIVGGVSILICKPAWNDFISLQ
ncbi:MAG: hypothetical protein GMKNLPBB_02479 [Myxococcota bacterium]|nr:hypothetical protein [Myxococcota bacterium]